MLPNKMIAIQNYGNSGTLFIQSLLDNHPALISLPGLFGQQLLPFWDRNNQLSKEEFILQFLQENEYWFSPEKFPQLTYEHGLMHLDESQDQSIAIDKMQFEMYFRELLSEQCELNRKLYLCSVFKAYNKVIGREYNEDAWIVYPIHSLPQKYAIWLTEDFGHAYFLHMIRNPVNLFGSLAKHINSHQYWGHFYLLECGAGQILNEFTIHGGNYPVHGATPFIADNAHIQSRGIKLEDLHKSPEQTLKSICKWLNIEWSGSLLISTFNGKQWFNRPESIKKSGFDEKITQQSYTEVFSTFDKARIASVAQDLLHVFGYSADEFKKIKFIKLAIWLPFAMEKNKGRANRQRQEIKTPEKRPYFYNKPILFPTLAYYRWRVKKYISARRWLLKCIKQTSDKNFVKLL